MATPEESVLDELGQMDTASLLSDLVGRPSFEQEEAVGHYLIGRLQALDVEAQITPISTGRFNVVAHYGPAQRHLILNTHMDTVPPGDTSQWQTSPLDPTVLAGRLYGRGACDAKASLTAMAAAFEALIRAKVPLLGRLTLMAVAYEETGAFGTIAEAERLSATSAAAIIGEPTGLELHLAHKGVLRLGISTLGKSAHASTPEQGVNAISGMARVIDMLDGLGARICGYQHPLVGHASLAVTTIQGGLATNVIPDRCRIVIDRRLIPGEDLECARREIEGRLRSLQRTAPELQVESESQMAIPPSQTPTDDPFVGTLLQVGWEALGREMTPGGFTACCDMWPLRGKGIPTVIFGPGELAQAHIVDEWVDLSQVEAAARFYALAALRWLGVGP